MTDLYPRGTRVWYVRGWGATSEKIPALYMGAVMHRHRLQLDQPPYNGKDRWVVAYSIAEWTPEDGPQP